MKRALLTVAFAFATLLCWSQVKLTSISRSGRLAWTNSVSARSPIYKVEWSGSPTGSWNVLAVVTNQTSIAITNAPSWGVSPTYYRVAWTNGNVWRYSGYDAQGLVATGKIYVDSFFDAGRWYLTNAGPRGDPFHPMGNGKLEACSLTPVTLTENAEVFCLEYGGESRFAVEGPWSGAVSFGHWYWEGGIIHSTASGPFVVERIINGK